MDTIPEEHCKGVFATIDRRGSNCSGKRETTKIHIAEVTPGNFFYSTSIRERPPFLKELLASDPILLRCDSIQIGPFQRENQPRRAVSKEKLSKQLIPFLIRQLSANSCLTANIATSSKTTSTVFKLLKNGHFSRIRLLYCGPKTEEFLECQATNMNLEQLELLGTWPDPSKTSQTAVTILKQGNLRRLWFDGHPRSCNLKVDFPVFKALFDLWVESKGARDFEVEGPVGVIPKEMNIYAKDFDSDVTVDDIAYKSDQFSSKFVVSTCSCSNSIILKTVPAIAKF
ncbi:hypothetical protein QR680_004603 [Steinernema hermaphroditum]|uniref:Uncharacterized protein n=1 Tax=Steinernema hermaphroditum TaxID=289476 RepID=A0AA39LTY0_9BILA|nr:hypothetical protein QR680_004603 [Steinernema hermaphroditum]